MQTSPDLMIQNLSSNLTAKPSLVSCQKFQNHLRWDSYERLSDLFEQRCDELIKAGKSKHLAIDLQSSQLTYPELDSRANQLARFLAAEGIQAGDRVGLLFDKSVETYIALIAVHKIGACFVPLDASFPPDRIEYILQDAGVRYTLTLSGFRRLFPLTNGKLFCLDEETAAIERQNRDRLSRSTEAQSADSTAYIVYTSGTTGRPKGVAVNHSSICNFVRVAAELYGYQTEDRVFQGMTIAFDFSYEEIFVPLMAGATLVPGPSGTNLVQQDLWQFLNDRKVTALCCVPTLLATLDGDLPELRLLLLSGEACPQDLVNRWHKPGRTLLNLYGPTEATVTTSWTVLTPEKEVTIGVPLPTYVMCILDENEGRVLPLGDLGELGVAGPGLAQGYINRDDLTAQKFIPDFLHLPNNPSGRIYRTGDLCRINENDEVEYHGRIDTQVKLRGYRIELTEIESVIMEFPGVAQAVVNVYSPASGTKSLVGYYTLRKKETEIQHSELATFLRTRLPGYMVPSYLELLPEIPLLPSHKADRKRLPPPQGSRLVATKGEHVEPKSETEALLARVLASVLKVERVSAEAHFFNELGADSLLMAQFCVAVREQSKLHRVSMRDAYLHPAIQDLATHIDAQLVSKPAEAPRLQSHTPSAFSYWLCGVLQAVYYLGYATLLFWSTMRGAKWVSHAPDLAEWYLRSLICAVVSLVGLIALPVLIKWILVGRWKPQKIPIWSLSYYRFWLVKHLIEDNPMALLKGTLLYNLYLNTLGAKVSLSAAIHTRFSPACPDLLQVGDESVLCRDSMVNGYIAEGNYIHIAPVKIGNRVYVGEATVVDIGSILEDDVQLAPVSLAQQGQTLKAGKRYHGTPSVETTGNFCRIEPIRCSMLRRIVYSLLKLCAHLALSVPAILASVNFVMSHSARTTGVRSSEWNQIMASPWEYLVPMIGLSSMLFIGLLVFELLVVTIVPRLLSPLLVPGKTYPLYGFHDAVRELIAFSSNSYSLHVIFGDSSAIVHYLRLIGYNLNRVIQTGTNFGTLIKHDSPFLCDVGSGTMASDGLSLNNLEMSGSSFRLSRVKIGAKNYLGNQIQFPADGKVGDNCLLATRVLIPIHGTVRENTGLLGSPCFEIPRTVQRDLAVMSALSEEDRKIGLAKKNAYNAVTALLFLFVYAFYFFVLITASDLGTILYLEKGLPYWLLAYLGFSIFSVLYFILAERATLGFKRFEAGIFSIYDRRFWRVERNWKMSENILMTTFWGTPFRNWVTRGLGGKIGRMVFDDGCSFPEKTLVEVGDFCNLNVLASLHCHSLEEGVCKSGPVKLGNSCSIGPAAFVHYNVTLADHVTLGANSFLMKGEMPENGTNWQGNPARPQE